MNGMPLLSHPPPESRSDEPACRKCNREFNFLFNRMKRCNHCGYAYCSSCCDFQALMPRTAGYDALPVCFFCIDMLTITASSKSRLRTLSLSTLRSYMKAYNIRTSGTALEKDDLVEAIMRAKAPNGCLLPAHEDYYRMNSVPQRSNEGSRPKNVLSRGARQETTSHHQPQPRQSAPPPPPPPPQQRHNAPPQRQYTPSSASSPPYTRASPSQNQHQQQHQSAPSTQAPFSQPRPFHHNPPPDPQPSRPHPSHAQTSSNTFRPSASQTNFHSRPSDYQPRARAPPPPRPRSAAPTVPPSRPPAPPRPVPSLDSLLQMNSDDVANLPISTLKTILFENRVNTSVGVLEKQDLVHKVIALVTDERRDREIKQREEQEEAERMEWARREREKEEEERKAAERERKMEETPESNKNDTKSPSSPSPSANPYPDKEDDGLCVVCQDEHANMAIIDCGHLALCKGCSEIVMKTSRECPLCRTRIVTEQRLLRIFKS